MGDGCRRKDHVVLLVNSNLEFIVKVFLLFLLENHVQPNIVFTG
jgi:hypothetical protein